MAYTLGNAVIYTGSELLDKGYVTIDDRKIVEVGKMESLRDHMDRDLHDMLVMPAWVNAHTHIYSTLARGMNVEFHPLSFTQILRQLWWRLDRALGPEEIEIGAMVAASEFIHNGIATVFDHHASPNFVKGSLEILKRTIVDTAGMRGVFCYETSDRNGKQRESIEENVNFYEVHKGESKTSGMMGLHASFTLSDETLDAVSKACDGKIPIHVHVAEGVEDELDSINSYDTKIINRFERHGILIPNSIYAHCIHVDEDEVNAISKSGGFIAINIQSNMNNSVGIPNLAKFRKNRTKVVLGNDGFGFSPSFDLRLVLLSQRHLSESPTGFSTPDLKEIIENTHELASRHLNERFGKIERGYAADIVVVDYSPPTPMTFDNFYDHLFFGITESTIDSLYVAGEPVMINGKIKTFDEKEIKGEARKVAMKLWERV